MQVYMQLRVRLEAARVGHLTWTTWKSVGWVLLVDHPGTIVGNGDAPQGIALRALIQRHLQCRLERLPVERRPGSRGQRAVPGAHNFLDVMECR